MEIPRKNLPLKMGGKNLNKDFTNTIRGGGGHHFEKVFHKIPVFFKGWLPLPMSSEILIYQAMSA